jgi:hypothetical protein
MSPSEIKRLQHTNDHLPPYSAEVHTEWNCAPNCLYVTRREQGHFYLYSFYAHYQLKDANIIKNSFNFHRSVHRKYIPIYTQQDATLHSLFTFENCSTYFGWYFHPSSEARTTVSTASAICYTVTAICRYRGRGGTHVPTPPR